MDTPALLRQLRHPADDGRVLLGGGVVLKLGVAVLLQPLGGLSGVLGEPAPRQGAVGRHGDVVLRRRVWPSPAPPPGKSGCSAPVWRQTWQSPPSPPGRWPWPAGRQSSWRCRYTAPCPLSPRWSSPSKMSYRGVCVVPHVVDVQVHVVHAQVLQALCPAGLPMCCWPVTPASISSWVRGRNLVATTTSSRRAKSRRARPRYCSLVPLW